MERKKRQDRRSYPRNEDILDLLRANGSATLADIAKLHPDAGTDTAEFWARSRMKDLQKTNKVVVGVDKADRRKKRYMLSETDQSLVQQ